MINEGEKRYKHKHYSARIIRTQLKDVIEDHPLHHNYKFKADDLAALLEGSTGAGPSILWRELIDSHIDADRMDYLLRDSLHTGVAYGRFDWLRLVNSVEVVPGLENRGAKLGVSEGGFHAAESLVLARYFMFTQVYFHKTRVAFDYHLKQALLSILPNGQFPPPDDEGLKEYLKWDDWKVLGKLADGEGGEHGKRLASRDHYREIYHTPEAPTTKDLKRLNRVKEKLGALVQAEESADQSWYKMSKPDIPIISDNPDRAVLPLSELSNVVKKLPALKKVMLYCQKEKAPEARNQIQQLMEKKK